MNSIFTRRSIRVYTAQPVEEEKIERILRAGMQAPSAKNEQPWEFLVVRNRDKLIQLSQAHDYSHMVAGADTAIITLANTAPFEPGQLWWASDMAACTQNILLQIVEEGLGGCWLGFWPRPERIDYVRRLFQLPDYIVPYSVIPLGYTERENKFKDRFLPDRIHWESY